MKLSVITKKYLVDLLIQFLSKSILRPIILTETIRQRGCQILPYVKFLWTNQKIIPILLQRLREDQ